MNPSPIPFGALVRASLFLLLLLGTAHGAITYRLSNHPDLNGSADYGLRLNNLGRDLSGGSGGTETIFEFDFDDPRGDGMFLTYDETLNEIRIFGSAYGGRVIDGAYSSDPSEVGKWNFEFKYEANVQAINPTDPAMLEVWVSEKDGTANSGSIQLDGSAEVYNFYEDPSPSNGGTTFEFRPDGYRLGPNGTILPDDMTFVGRGWLGYDADKLSGSFGTQDWIFTATVIPEPSSALMLGLGGITLLSRRRRAGSRGIPCLRT